MILKSTLIGLAAMSSVAVASTAGADFGQMEAATAAMAKAVKAPLTVEPLATNRFDGFALVEGDRIFLSPAVAGLAQSPQEARALVSLVLAYQDHQFSARAGRKPGLVEYAVAWPLHLVAEARSNGSGGYGQLAQNSPAQTGTEIQAEREKRGRKRAALALDLAGKAGSCAGPMVDLLQRMRGSAEGGGETASVNQPSGFARQVLRDLGRSVYPPDRSCG
jgi:hypothetical protein